MMPCLIHLGCHIGALLGRRGSCHLAVNNLVHLFHESIQLVEKEMVLCTLGCAARTGLPVGARNLQCGFRKPRVVQCRLVVSGQPRNALRGLDQPPRGVKAESMPRSLVR